MNSPNGVSRRGLFAKVGLAFNVAAGAILAVPIVRYLLSPVLTGRRSGIESWLSLGSVDQFPVGQTRLANYRNPIVYPSDGETANIPCWVRRLDAEKFQVFAINCAHLGCPVRWFPQSGLFMCPCHGGVYYEDGSRASGPPERGLFEYPYKVQQGALLIEGGKLPTTGSPNTGLTNISLINKSPGIKPPCG
jgi:menaquinol-cytochrome c reductase iron-sulfur subunit